MHTRTKQNLHNHHLHTCSRSIQIVEMHSYVSASYCVLTLTCSSGQLASSDARTVRLKTVYLATSGQFRCEVSLEAPSFDTYYDYGDMIVVGEFT